MDIVLKALMAGSIGLTCASLGFMAPRGIGLTSQASPEKVQASPGAGPGNHTRGPRYVFVGGLIGGK